MKKYLLKSLLISGLTLGMLLVIITSASKVQGQFMPPIATSPWMMTNPIVTSPWMTNPGSTTNTIINTINGDYSGSSIPILGGGFGNFSFPSSSLNIPSFGSYQPVSMPSFGAYGMGSFNSGFGLGSYMPSSLGFGLGSLSTYSMPSFGAYGMGLGSYNTGFGMSSFMTPSYGMGNIGFVPYGATGLSMYNARPTSSSIVVIDDCADADGDDICDVDEEEECIYNPDC